MINLTTYNMRAVDFYGDKLAPGPTHGIIETVAAQYVVSVRDAGDWRIVELLGRTIHVQESREYVAAEVEAQLANLMKGMS